MGMLLIRLRQDGLIMVFGLKLGLEVCPDQGQKVQWAWDHVLYHKARAQSSMGLGSYLVQI